MDVTAHWNFSDPAATEETFRVLRESTDSALERAIFDTQIARTFSLRREFENAHAVLQTIDPAIDPEVATRFELELGRTHNSAGEVEAARRHFDNAAAIAERNRLEYLLVDAVHMQAISAPSPEKAIEFNELALQLAETATDLNAQNWQGSLLNNLAWAHHDLGHFDRALELFLRTVDYWIERAKPDRESIARWSVARCYRSLERHDEALEILRALLEQQGDPTGYTSQEIGWNLVALGSNDDAKPFFADAVAQLANDAWYVAEKGEELERMRALS